MNTSIVNFLISLLLSTFLSAPAQDYWEPTNGPHGGPVFSVISISPDTMMATVGFKIYFSTDNGNSWTLSNFSENLKTWRLFVNSSREIYLIAEMDIYLSNDFGISWVKTQYPDSISAYKIVFSNNGGIFVTTGDHGIYYSSDKGITWIKTTFPDNYIIYNSICCDSSGNVFVGTNDGVYRSINNGNSWQIVLPHNREVIVVGVDKNENIFAGLDGDGLYKSDNAGNSWSKTNFPNSVLSGYLVFNSNNDIFFYTNKLYISTDQGTSWSSLSISDLRCISSLTIDNNDNLIAGTLYNGVFLSIDNGITWHEINTGIRATLIYDMAITSNGDLFACAGNMYHSNDEGFSWSRINFPDSALADVISCNSYGHIFVGTADHGVYRSTDNGITWQKRFWGSFINSISLNSNDEIYCGVGHGGVFKSSDNGNTWELKLWHSRFNEEVKIACYGISDVYVNIDGESLRSLDNGENWQVTGFPDTVWARNIAIEQNGSIYISGWPNELFLSVDSGSNWNKTNFPDSLDINSIAFNSNSDVFIATDKGVYNSMDNGLTWHNFGLNDYSINSIVFNNEDYLFAGTHLNGVFKSKNATINVESSIKTLSPAEFFLAQNYPNPFNPSTNIEFSIPTSEFVTLKVYNILGEEVATLVSKRLVAGKYKYDWDASSLASGVYLYRIQAGDYMEAKKTILLR